MRGCKCCFVYDQSRHPPSSWQTFRTPLRRELREARGTKHPHALSLRRYDPLLFTITTTLRLSPIAWLALRSVRLRYAFLLLSETFFLERMNLSTCVRVCQFFPNINWILSFSFYYLYLTYRSISDMCISSFFIFSINCRHFIDLHDVTFLNDRLIVTDITYRISLIYSLLNDVIEKKYIDY